jgi:hypothetical protein
MCLKVQVHQSWTFGSSAVQQCFIAKVISRPSGSAIEVNEHLMERLFDKLLNRSGLTWISHQQGLQIIVTSCRYFCRELRRRRGLVIHTWDPVPSWITPPKRWRTPKRCSRTSSTLATTLGGNQGHSSQVRGPIHVKFESISGSRSSL